MKQHQTNSFISRAAAMLLTVILAFAGAQTAGAQKKCNVTFDISGGGTVEFGGDPVTNGDTIVCSIPYVSDLTITPETGYYVPSVTYVATDGLSIDLNQVDDFHCSLYIDSYEGSEMPTITVHIVFDKGLAGGADEASAVALTADDDLSHLAGGWYKVESDLTIDHTVNLHGDTHITIATGKTLTVNTSDDDGISGSALTVSGEGTLAVSASKRAIYVYNYTQTGCAVTLSGSDYGLHAKNEVSISGGSLTTSGATNGIFTDYGAITISGGTVSSSGKQCGLYATKAMNITGGTVSASGNNYGIRGYSVSITGGQVTASSGGIRSSYGDITLGCTSDTDYITASGYVLQKDGKHVKIADGQKLYGSGFPSTSYTGTIDDPSVLNGQLLRPFPAFTESGTNEYTIRYADGWDVFCLALQDNDTWNRFTGKTVKLGADITVTQSAGGEGHEFMGTFDGDGKTLIVNITDTENQGTAPFRFISNATIRNLHVTGSVTGTAHASGLVGKACAGTILIENCLVEANVNSTVGDTNGNKHCGGIVGHGFGGSSPVSLTLRNCVYAGTITCDKNFIGGLQGWSDGNTLTLENCLFAGNYQGTEAGTAAFHPIALHNTGSATNLTATNVFAAVAPTATNADFIAADGTKTTGRTSAPANLGTQGATYNYMNMTVYEHGLLYNGLYYVAPTLSTDSDNAYLINNEDDWTNFCDALYNNGTWNRFSGKTVKLANDISVTGMAGSSGHDFCGTFDGQEHTLTFNYGTAGSYASDEYAAPFHYVSNVGSTAAAFRNLHVAGHIYTSAKYAAGLIAQHWGTVNVENCRVSTVIHSSVSGDGTHGGIEAVNNGVLNITGTVFDGKLLTTTTNGTDNCGGFVGWHYGGTTNISNSLYAPAAIATDETEVGPGTDGQNPSATFGRNAVNSIANSYYTRTLGTAQGKQLRTIAAGEGVNLGHDGVATEYSVSGITAYKATGASGDNDPFIAGIIYNNVLYGGSGDAVSLTLANSSGDAPLGYQWAYSVSGGATLSGTKLIMSDEDVTVRLALSSTGEAVPVSYIDEDGILCDGQDGRPAPASAIALDGTETEIGQYGEETWYFVGADISYGAEFDCYGDVHIILTDGKTMTVTSNSFGIYGYTNGCLTIYGQTLGTGTLNATGTNYGIFHQNGIVVICGGTVNATGTYSTGISANGDVTINGGKVTATSTNTGIYANGSVTITGGKVTATGNNSGIYSEGDITLGCTKASDYITASSYEFGPEGSHLLIWGPLYDEDGNEYSGNIVDYYDLAGKTLRPLRNVLALDDAADNSAAIAASNGQQRNVILYGRTLYKDGAWNTLCLPFDLELAGSPLDGDGVDVRTLSSSSFQDGTLTLNFTPSPGETGAVTTLRAGQPYIIKWDDTGQHLTENDLVFRDAEVSAAAPALVSTDYVDFIGTYDPVAFSSQDQSVLFLSTNNTLYFPKSGTKINPFRAYFQLTGGTAEVREFRLNFGEDDATRIGSITMNREPLTNDSWFTLDGRRLNGKPTKKGVYIVNGRKVVVK